MANRIAWAFIFALAALQSSFAAPPANRWQLQFEVTNELFQMITEALEELRNVFQLVIDEAELILPPNTKSLILTELKELVAAVDSLNFDDSLELSNLEEALEEMQSVMEIADSREFESEADEVVLQLFIQHGVDDLEKILELNLETTLKAIEMKVQNYLSTWSDSRLARNSDLVKQFKDFKNEEDVYEKLDKLSNFDLFN
ncbi:uncharacterized protein LOC128261599 [Drosophila gunungcola]|uniref:Uncharacterized protein n=1 Tax=Drosophila gunungcola TaxID=103775 RepID=A0A9P9YTY8_9MUSC|nr:uncharacterized protein LOC128261599 [Drosophila gunungcola]KAI8043083.1 hypothetical protein M5D96_004409 [Drosophila gunungcola]